MKKKIALITGITGQDGSYLAELLVKKNYQVHGIRRRASVENLQNLENLNLVYQEKKKDIFLHYGDMTDATNLIRLFQKIKPDEVYNLAAQSHVKVSFDLPEYTAETDGIGTLRILEAVRICGLEKTTKIYQASTSELFGKVSEIPQKETTPFYPRSPYGVAKLYAYWTIINYREAYNLFACNGILFNHESPRRGETFITRKITLAAARIKLGMQDKLVLGNLDSIRDWGYAPEYVEGMWRMLQQKEPEDFVIATGRMVTVREFIELCAQELGWSKNNKESKGIIWEGTGVNEIGRRADNKEIVIKIDPKYFRPTEVDELLGDSSKALKKLNWQPKITLEELIKEMINFDKQEADKESLLIKEGFSISVANESPPNS